MWLTTEGVFGIALGVSTGTIFVYVLFGTLLDRAGGGNYMMQVSFAALGHLRGGPAKVSVVSSALNGMISGSSVSNVVSGGIFTIPLMKKAGYGGVKAGAIETMSSVDGQIMPPVMGAAAFLMVEYVGIPYSEIVRNAILPATLSYIGLFYIVHLEALKLGMQPIIRREPRPMRERALRFGFGVSGTIVVVGVLYYLLDAIKATFGAAAPWVAGALVVALYVGATWMAARAPTCPRTSTSRTRGRSRPGPRSRPACTSCCRSGCCLVPDGRGDVAVALGVLGDRHAGGAHGHAAPADRGVPRTSAPGAWSRGFRDVSAA
jgi:TRAP transporter 4TM/12TM fusion protein